MDSILRYFPFPLQAFPTRKGPDFCSDWCFEGNLPGSLQQLHRAAPAAPEPAGPGDRAQGTAPCSALFTAHVHSSGQGKGFILLCVSWPLATHSLLHVVALPSLPSVVTQSVWWSLEAKQEVFSCCLPGPWESCPVVPIKALPSVLGEQGGRWNSALEMVPLRKSVSSEGCHLRGLNPTGCLQAGGAGRWDSRGLRHLRVWPRVFLSSG